MFKFQEYTGVTQEKLFTKNELNWLCSYPRTSDYRWTGPTVGLSKTLKVVKILKQNLKKKYF